ncbi:MAG: helix-hairpin-helix domain-containing protein [Bacteroidota bacterium]
MFFLCWLLISPCTLSAQRDSLPPAPIEADADLIEDFIQNNENDNGFDFNTVYEILEGFRQQPLDLNKANVEDLKELLLLTDIQINSLLNHRRELGNLISIYELQSIPGFDLAIIRRIQPFVRVGGGIDNVQLSLGQMLGQSNSSLFARWFRPLQESRGFREDRFEGDPNQLYLRYRMQYGNKMSLGFTAEKDPGEAFFNKSNPNGFDYYSAHFYLRDYNHWLKSLAIGDFTASFGQGLLMFAGFGYGKTPRSMDIKRSRRSLRPYASVNENNYLRGIGVTLQLSPQIELTTFASFNQRDGNIVQLDTLDNEEEINSFTSLQQSGLHRTEAEIADEDAVNSQSYGASLKYKKNNWHIAYNAVYHHFKQPFQLRAEPYNLFNFQGRNNFSTSIDYSLVYRNYNFFGETAISDNGSMATTNGLLLGMSRQMSVALLYRNFSRSFQSLASNAFAESRIAQNENGIYIGLEYIWDNNWQLNAYADFYRHPWLRFNVDAPSRGYEYRVRLTYFRKRSMTSWFEFRTETKQINAPNNETPTNFLVDSRLTQFRWHLQGKLGKGIELRTRIHGGFDNGIRGETLRGILLYQDIIYNSRNFPLSFSARFALFDTDGFNVRFYTYENNLSYTFTVPSFADQGNRFYINVRFKGIRKLTLEARYARTYWPKLNEIGTGDNRVQSNVVSNVSSQVIWRF